MKQHSFSRGVIDSTVCAKCRRPEVDHGSSATCEACTKVGECEVLGSMLLCVECLRKEYEIAVNQQKERSADIATGRIQLAMDNPIGAIAHSVTVDQSLTVKSDIYNAEVTSIVELRSALTSQSQSLNGVNVDFELAKLIQSRYEDAKKAYFEANAAVQAANSRMRAQAQALNDLASKLTAEQREQTKLQDLTYQPTTTPKTNVSKPAKKEKVTIAEKMAMNLVAARLNIVASQLVRDGTCSNIDEAKSVAKARGLVMSIEKARQIVAAEMGVS
jgi:hypothetical protein